MPHQDPQPGEWYELRNSASYPYYVYILRVLPKHINYMVFLENGFIKSTNFSFELSLFKSNTSLRTYTQISNPPQDVLDALNSYHHRNPKLEVIEIKSGLHDPIDEAAMNKKRDEYMRKYLFS